jgi:hypothetical protein
MFDHEAGLRPLALMNHLGVSTRWRTCHDARAGFVSLTSGALGFHQLRREKYSVQEFVQWTLQFRPEVFAL